MFYDDQNEKQKNFFDYKHEPANGSEGQHHQLNQCDPTEIVHLISANAAKLEWTELMCFRHSAKQALFGLDDRVHFFTGRLDECV